MRRPRSRRGFTLTEVLIFAAMAGIVSLAASGLFLHATRFNRQASARSQNQRDARVSLLTIERELSQARGRTIVIDRLDASQPHYSRIAFSLFDGRTVTVYQKGTKLYRQVSKGGVTSRSLVATGLRQAVFSYPMSDNSSLVSIGLTFERGTYEGASKSLQLSLARVRIQNADAY